MLSDMVAERLVQLRKAARLSREEFAERCRQLGGDDFADFSAAALTNVETGRRDRSGRRRRKITIDEVAVFARALGIPVTWLGGDPTSAAPVKIFDDTEVDPWSVLAWMIGARPLDEQPGQDWTEAAGHLGRLRELYLQVQHYELLRELYDPQYHTEPPVGLTEEESKRQGLKAIWDRLEPFRKGGMPLPPVPDHIREGIGEVLLDQVRTEVENLQHQQELLAAKALPEEGDPRPSDTADAKTLRRLAEALRRVHNGGLVLPPLPDTVTTRAKDLDVNLTPFL